ncbi:MAG: lecithin retinol acyltransferase family protein [Cyclobacteriaceae bacterium]|jgi:hypothetical protein|nr:lecithin retinol acyltransferase family protein [Cyclobacteriaceae bacterium]
MDYVKFYKLKPGDRIVASKSFAGIVQHHAIYLGQNYQGQDLIAENVYEKFVAVVDSKKFFAEYPQVTRIEAFKGNNVERRVTIERALKLLSKPYSLINFNCEHFVNYVQHGKVESKQIDFALGLGAFVLLIGLVASIND